jgi:transposase-like protein
VLAERGVMEQRYRAAREVLEDRAPVITVARLYGVARRRLAPWDTMRNQQKETAPGGVVAEWEWFPRRPVRTVQQKG